MLKPLVIALVAASLAVCGSLPEDFVAAGATYNGYASPQVNGWAIYAHRVTDSKIYNFNTVDVTSVTKTPFSAQVSYRTGIATVVKDRIAGVTVLAVAEAGMAAAGENVGGAVSAAGVVVTRLKKNWRVVMPVRVTKTALSDYQVSLGLGIGWGAD